MKRSSRVFTSVLSLILSICILNIVPLIANAAESEEKSVGASSGITGDCTWALDNSGVLTISGQGEMGGYYYSQYDIPWYYSRKSIKKVIVEEGVTTVGCRVFYDCTNLTSVTLPYNLNP